MISPDARPEAPAALTSREVTEAIERARAFFERPARDRAQESFVFDDGLLAHGRGPGGAVGRVHRQVRLLRDAADRAHDARRPLPALERRARARRHPESRPLLVARLCLGEHVPELRRVPELQGRALPGARRASAGRDDGRRAARREPAAARAAARRPRAPPRLRRGRLGRLDHRRGQRDDRDPRAQPRAARRGARRGPRRAPRRSGRRSPRRRTSPRDSTRSPSTGSSTGGSRSPVFAGSS